MYSSTNKISKVNELTDKKAQDSDETTHASDESLESPYPLISPTKKDIVNTYLIMIIKNNCRGEKLRKREEGERRQGERK